MGADPRRLPRGSGAARRRLAPRPRRDQRRRRRARAGALGQRTGQPHGVGRRRRVVRARSRSGRERGVIVASDECYAEFAPRARRRSSRPDSTACSRCTAFRSARTSRACASASTRAIPSSCTTSSRRASTRAHGADAGASGGGGRARRRRARRRATRALRRTARARAATRSLAHGLVHDGGPPLFYLWLRAADGADDGWEIAARLAHEAGLLVSPGDLYGAGRRRPRAARAGAADRTPRARARPARRARNLKENGVDDLAKQVTQLWEAGDDWRDVMPPRRRTTVVRSVIAHARPRRDPRRGGRRRRGRRQRVRRSTRSSCGSASTTWQIVEAGPFEYVDKLPLKHGYQAAGVRVVPGASARFGATSRPVS